MMSNYAGFLLVFAAGVCWIALGIAVSACTSRNWNYNVIQGVSFTGASLICAVILAVKTPFAGIGTLWEMAFLMSCLAGMGNFYTYVLVSRAMKSGPNGLVWGIMQAGMIGSFLMGTLIFGEKAALLPLLGLALILSGVFAMGSAKKRSSQITQKGWLLPAMGAFSLLFICHCLNALPSFFPDWSGNTPSVRTLGMNFGGLVGFLITTLPGMIHKKNYGTRNEWITGVILTLINTAASVLFFYNGLDLLARNGRAGLGYPVAIGVCVTGFSLYSLLVLKEKYTPFSLAGLSAVCIGIIVISLR